MSEGIHLRNKSVIENPVLEELVSRQPVQDQSCLVLSKKEQRNLTIGEIALGVLGIAGVILAGYFTYKCAPYPFLCRNDANWIGGRLVKTGDKLCNNTNGHFFFNQKIFEGCFPFSQKIVRNDIRPSTIIYRNYSTGHSTVDIRMEEMPMFDGQELSKISLFDLNGMNGQEREGVIRTFGLEEKIKSFENFFGHLKVADPKALQQTSLQHLISENCRLKYFVMSSDEIGAFPLSELIEKVSADELKVIKRALNTIQKPSLATIKEEILQTPLVEFAALRGAQINQVMAQLPPPAFSLLSKDQLSGIDFSKPSREQIRYLESVNGLSFLQINQMLQAETISNQLLIDMPDEYLDNFDLSLIKTREQLDALLSCPSKIRTGSIDYAKRSTRLAKFSVEQINQMLRDGKISDKLLKHIPDGYLNKLEVSAIKTREQLDHVLHSRCRHLAKFSVEQINQMLRDGKISDKLLKHIPDGYLNKLEVSAIKTREQLDHVLHSRYKHLAKFSVEQINQMLRDGKISDKLLRHIPDEYLNKLEVSAIKTREQLDELIGHAGSKRLANFSPAQVNQMLELGKFHHTFLLFLSNDHLKQLNFSTLTLSQLEEILTRRIDWLHRGTCARV